MGQAGNRDGVGARVAVTTPGNRPQVAHVLRVAAAIRVTLDHDCILAWETAADRTDRGAVERRQPRRPRNLPANQLMQIREGSGAFTKTQDPAVMRQRMRIDSCSCADSVRCVAHASAAPCQGSALVSGSNARIGNRLSPHRRQFRKSLSGGKLQRRRRPAGLRSGWPIRRVLS
jgi:hypothetical protein